MKLERKQSGVMTCLVWSCSWRHSSTSMPAWKNWAQVSKRLGYMRWAAFRIRYGQLGWLCDGAVYMVAVPVHETRPQTPSAHGDHLLLF